MTALAWQTLLLLGFAYLLGCWIACLARRMIGVRDELTTERREPIPVPALQPAPGIAVPARPDPIPAAPSQGHATAPVREAFRRADTLEPVARPIQATPPRAPQASQTPGPTASAPAASAPSAGVPRRTEDPVVRFEQALSGPGSAGQTPAPAPAPAPPRVASSETTSTAAMAAAAAGAAAAAAVARQANHEARLPAGAGTPSVNPRSVPTPVRQPTPPVVAAPPQPPAAARSADDLKRIRTIDPAIETALNKLGVTSYAEIGAWRPGDVARVSQALGFKGRIEQENWIEQAQILASGKDTHYSSRIARGEVAAATRIADEGRAAVPPAPAATAPAGVPAPRSGIEVAAAAAAALAAATAAARAVTPPAPRAPAAAAPPPERASPPAVSDNAAFAQTRRAPAPVTGNAQAAPSAPPPAAPRVAPPATTPAAESRPAVGSQRDQLQRIGGVTPEIERLLNVQGISRYAQVAGWSGGDVERFDRLLGYQGRIQRENWIEQAQVLARGGETAYSREHDRRIGGETRAASVVTRVQAPSTRVPDAPPAPATNSGPNSGPSSSSPAAAGVAAGTAALAAAAAAAAAAIRPASAAPSVPTPAVTVTPVSVTAVPVASPGSAPVKSETASSGEPTRAPVAPVAPDADGASAAGTPRPARLAEAIRGNEPRTPDLSSFRSVRSEAFRGGATGGASRPGEIQDLKRIRGIGVLIEKKLNSMGVTRYDQIAEWTVSDIERVSHVLDFKGRIERENWVEQARILASGGQTEFSRRADRGELGG